MNWLLRRLDVDPLQWRVLLRASLRIDFPIGRSNKTSEQRRTMNVIALVLIIYIFAGSTPAVIAYRVADPLFGGTSLAMVAAFMIAATLLAGDGANVVSPNDHQILGYRPVTSRTYLAVRIGALMVRTVVAAALVSLLPFIVFTLKPGGSLLLATSALVGAELCAIAATLSIVALYGWVLRVAGAERVLQYTGYMQLAASSTVWGGFMIMSKLLNTRALDGLSLSSLSWWIVLPPAWFGSYAVFGAGHGGWLPALALLLSLASIVFLGWVIRDKLSMGYTEELSRLAAVTAQAAPRSSDWLGSLSYETRAIAILVRSQLEHDMKFRLGLLSLVPMTVIYMIAGGWPTDPFVLARGAAGSGGPGIVQLALIFIPISLRQTIVNSESYRASWIFHTTPSDRGRLVLSSRNVITGFFLVPYVACLAALFAWSFGNATHALLHAVFLGLLSWMILQLTIMLSPQLPFSMPYGKDADAAMRIVHMVVAVLVGLSSYFLLVKFVYRHADRMIATGAAFIAVGYLMDGATRFRVRRRPIEKMVAE